MTQDNRALGASTVKRLLETIDELRKQYAELAAMKNKTVLLQGTVAQQEARFMSEAAAAKTEDDKPVYRNQEARDAYVTKMMAGSPEARDFSDLRLSQTLLEGKIQATEKENATLRSILQWCQAQLTDDTWQRIAPRPNELNQFLKINPDDGQIVEVDPESGNIITEGNHGYDTHQ